MKILIAIAVVFSFASCKEKTSLSYPKPENLIEREQMIGILTELSVVEAGYQVKYIQVTRYSYLLQQDADSIFKVFGTDKQAYDESMTYYTHHQEEMLEIYQAVKVNLEKKLAELPQEVETETEERIIKEIRDEDNVNLRIRTEEDM